MRLFDFNNDRLDTLKKVAEFGATMQIIDFIKVGTNPYLKEG